MLVDSIVAFGQVDADGNMIEGSGNWDSFKDDSWGAPGVYRVELHHNPMHSLTVIVSPGHHDTHGGQDTGIDQSDNIFVPFDVTPNGFGVNSRDISGRNAGNEDAAFNFVVFGM
ncbi:MAG: hypothetical protein ACPGWR_18950 [Ardenticatenaceae bacterium]